MPFERRLHPASVLFAVAGQARALIVPALAILFTAGTTDRGWQPWMMVLFVPFAATSILHYVFYRYRFDDTELVVRTGFVFRNERHIPYARIQNIDAVQNVLHRLLNVVEVRVETGAGGEADAVMRVLPVSAFHEMRALVFRTRPIDGRMEPAEAAPGQTLLALPAGELLLSGFIDNRSAIVIAAAFGLFWELGVLDRLIDITFGAEATNRAAAGQLVRSLLGEGIPPLGRIAWMAGALVLLLLVLRVLSMVWAVIRLHGFVLGRAGEDLRTEFGLFTRVATTIPLRRIQTLTIEEGPLHRLFRRASVKVDTAGGDDVAGGASRREPLAPIIRHEALPGLVEQVLPEVDFTAVAWRAPAPRALRRAFNRAAAVALVISMLFVLMLGWWTLALLAALLALAFVHARLYVSHLGWATLDGAVLCRRGWLWRRVSIARFSKMQVVSLRESPFDRRTRMARLVVDTAGGGAASGGVEIPYLARQDADTLYRHLTIAAAETTFRW